MLCLIVCSCNKKPHREVIPPGGVPDEDMYIDVCYSYNTYEEMVAAGKKCDKNKYSYLFDFQFEGVNEYSYNIRAMKKGGKKTEDEEITPDVLVRGYIITGKFDDEKEFSLYFYIFGDKTTLEVALKENYLYVWESSPDYDEYDDYARYFLHRCKYTTSSTPYLSEALFEGQFEDELIQQILDYIHISIFSQKEE